MNDDLSLVERYKNGDEKAFDELFERYKEAIYSVCYRFVRNEEDARDLTQDTFIKIYRNIKSFNGKSKFFTWIYRIAVNTCISFRRKSRNEEEFNNSISKEPERNIPLKKAIDDALSKLPSRQRMTFILRHYEGYTFEEISEIMGISTGAAKANHFQAVKKLRIYLKDWV
jgi:RNA polymerase sigma-70 factor (ECF subfamily)|uniref:Sigma-70 family RNA polymerase sigma factor n=1 Tax=candidate division WOR-3 bacterium TaxID=2052148 RepID=A0A7V3VUK8_UNCW3